MKVGPNTVVKFEFTLCIDQKIVERTLEAETQTILIGHAHGLPVGLEKLLHERTAGENFTITLEPIQAYGEYDPSKRINVAPSDFPVSTKLELGGLFYTQDATGQALTARVVALEGDWVAVDFNHEHAGKTLEYAIKIHTVREAESGELEHGHVHGEGGVTHKHAPDESHDHQHNSHDH